MSAPGPSKSRFSHLPRVFARASLFLLPVVLLVTFLAVRAARQNSTLRLEAPRSTAEINENSQDLITTPLARRAIFPYSIVPGGVRDAHELHAVVMRDPVVAQHYSGFRIEQARTLRLDHPLAMYVSYRRNGRVYWTKNRMVIPVGETLISDGENLARVRCANRLSAVAVKPVAATEPTKEELSEPSFVPPLLAELLPGEGNDISPGPQSAIPALPLLPPGPSALNTPTPPFFPPILPPGVPPFVPTITPPPPISTPEPSLVGLLFAGAALLLVFSALSLRRNGS